MTDGEIAGMADAENTNTALVEVVTFEVGGEEYGMDALRVREIVPLPEVTRIPNLPAFLKGVVNLRGAVVPVMDVRLRMGMTSASYSQRTSMIIVEAGEGVMGLVIDTVSDVLSLPAAAMTDIVETGLPRCRFTEKFGRYADKMIMMLNIDTLLCWDLPGC